MSNFKVVELVKCPHCNGKGNVPRRLNFWGRLLGYENTEPCYFCELDLWSMEHVVTRFVDLDEAIKQSERKE